MIRSKVTGRAYEPSDAIFMTNPRQCMAYLRTLGTDAFLDILYESSKRDDALVFVWKKCPETRDAKIKWDQHLL